MQFVSDACTMVQLYTYQDTWSCVSGQGFMVYKLCNQLKLLISISHSLKIPMKLTYFMLTHTCLTLDTKMYLNELP